MPTPYQEILANLYGHQSPFSGVDLNYVDLGYPHTNLLPEVLELLFEVRQPEFILELGSMLGGSAIMLAKHAISKSKNASVICVDPFTGDVNMWDWEIGAARAGEWQFLRLENGVPTIYKRFLANIVHSDMSHCVLPINVTSIVGMKLIRRLNDQRRLTSLPNYIYLDSAHEPGETFLELCEAWKTLTTGGILFGDDWSWSAVRSDVIKFANLVPQLSNHDILLHFCSKLPGSKLMSPNLLTYQGQWIIAKQ